MKKNSWNGNRLEETIEMHPLENKNTWLKIQGRQR